MTYDCVAGRDWMTTSSWVPIFAVVMYMVLFTWGKSSMKDAKAWDWRTIMVSFTY